MPRGFGGRCVLASLLSLVGVKCHGREVNQSAASAPTTEDGRDRAPNSSASEPPAAEPKLEVLVVEIDFHKGQLESAVYPRVQVAFTNRESFAVEVTRVRVNWTDGHKQVEPQDLVLAPGQREIVKVVIKPDGTLTRPTLEDTRVDWSARRHTAR